MNQQAIPSGPSLRTSPVFGWNTSTLLFLCGEAQSLVEDQVLLRGCLALALFRLGYGCEEVGAPARFQDLLGRLTLLVQLPVARRARVRRIQDRMIKERVRHIEARKSSGRSAVGDASAAKKRLVARPFY